MSTELDAQLARYRLIRQRQFEINSQISHMLTKKDLHLGGRELGILKNNTLVFDSESLMEVMFDYCHFRRDRKGRTAIKAYITANPPRAGSIEETVLTAMTKPRYSVFKTEAREPGYGLRLRDLLHNEALFVMDVNMSESVSVNQLVAGRILPVDPSFWMSTGALLPMDNLSYDYFRSELMPKYALKNGNDIFITWQSYQQLEADLLKRLIINGVGDRFETEKLT